jgi:hypothetical protein
MARLMGVHNGFTGVTAGQSREAYPPGRMSSPVYWLSFQRIIDVPFETCLATLESWQHTGQDGELRIGQSLLRWPIEHNRESGTCRSPPCWDHGWAGAVSCRQVVTGPARWPAWGAARWRWWLARRRHCRPARDRRA